MEKKRLKFLDWFKKPVQQIPMRRDGWQNLITSIGTYNNDKTLKKTVATFNRLESEEAEAIYSSDKMARKIVETIVKTALMHGYRLTFEDMNEDELEKFNTQRNDIVDKKYKIPQLLNDLLTWSRIYGVSYLLPGYRDGQELDQPLDLKRIKSIDYFKAFTPRELYPLIPSLNPISENYLHPEFYTFASYGGAYVGKQIHHSRVIRCEGIHLPRYLFIQNGYKHDSVITPIRDLLSDYYSAIKSLNIMLSEYSVGVYKVKGLHSFLSAGGNENKFLKKLRAMDQAQSIINSKVLDADSEEYERKQGGFNGVAEIIFELRKELATQSDIPHTILFNEGAGHSGSSLGQSSGKSEMSDWQEKIFEYQKNTVKPILNSIYSALFHSQDNPLKGSIKENLDNFEILFTPTRTMTLEEEAESYNNFASADQIYLDQGTITANEIRTSRFGRFGTFSKFGSKIQIEIDEEASKEFKGEGSMGEGEQPFEKGPGSENEGQEPQEEEEKEKENENEEEVKKDDDDPKGRRKRQQIQKEIKKWSKKEADLKRQIAELRRQMQRL